VKRVLIVDDERSFLLSLKDGLQVHADNFEVLTAENGREAVGVLRALPIDLLVTDLKLPEMDGFELLAWVSRYQPKLPVIVMTAFGTPDIEARVAGMNTLQYLEKPLDLKILEEGILSGLESREKSYIRGITLSTFLQLMSIEKKTCTLKVTSGERVGYLYIRRGEMLDASYDQLLGEAAALEIVGWEDAEIEMDGICRRYHGEISLSIEHILIEAFRRKDEEQHQEEQAETTAESVSISEAQPFEGNQEIPPAGGQQLSKPEIEHSRERLLEILSRLRPIQEFAIFDQNSFLEEKNPGTCTLAELDPAIFSHLLDQLQEKISFGEFSHLILSNASRSRVVLFHVAGHLVVIRLRAGVSATQLLKEINSHINR